MISVDTETTGVDVHHGARPFFVTTCTEDGEQRYWEWAVDPLTREPQIPAGDVQEIGDYLFADGDRGPGPFVLQNAKFDYAMLRSVGLWDLYELDAVWATTYDTLLAGHLLASNLPHNLTDMAIQYLGVNIEPYEQELEVACNEARRLCRTKAFVLEHGEWALAKAGRADMPSAKEKCWKYDTWLPRALAQELEYPAAHPWWTVLRTYANADSAVTVQLWRAMRAELGRRGLTALYDTRRQLLPVAYEMEERGVSLDEGRTNEMTVQLEREIAEMGTSCVAIAAEQGYELTLPKGASPNASLRTFVFDVLKMEGHRGKKAKTDAPSLDKNVIAHYLLTELPESPAGRFFKTLSRKRKRDSDLSYALAYERFRLRDEIRRCTYLHPNLNPTGTDTLRWSSDNPNSQNISKQDEECEACEGEGCDACRGTGKERRSLRYCFGPAPGREWWSLDARGIEDRLPAYKSGQRELIEIFEKADQPPYYGSNHLLRFHTVYPEIWNAELAGVGFEKVGPHCKKRYAATNYQWCKNGGFAVQYGAVLKANGWGTADRAFHKQYSHQLLVARFSNLEALNQQQIKFAEKYGYVETMPDQTVDPLRGYPLLCSRTQWGGILPTVPLNYYIQGTAMWWMGKAMIRCSAQLKDWTAAENRLYCFALQVHDELVFDFPAGQGSEPWRTNLPKVRRLKRLMEEGGRDLGIPTPVSVEYNAANWSEGLTIHTGNTA